MKSRKMLALIAGATAIAFSGPVLAQAPGMPSKMQILVGVAAGGPNDSIARMLSDRLRVKMNVTAVVENRAGANGMIAANALLKAPPNGQTILITSQGLVTISPHLSAAANNPGKDMTPIAGFATTDTGFCIANKVPADNMRDFVRYAKQAPKPVSLGAAGLGNITHLLLEQLRELGQFPYSLVVYKGIAPSLQDVAGGHIDGSVCALVTAIPLIKAQRLKLAGLFGDKRSMLFPDVPTTAEQGLPMPDASWYAIFGPPAMPQATVMLLFNAFKEIVSEPETVQQLAKVGFEPWIHDPVRLTEIIREESARWGKLIRDNNIKAE